MKKLTSLLLIIVMLLSLCGCNTDKSPLAGSWSAELDMTDSFNAFLEKYTEDNGDFLSQQRINELKRDMVIDECTLIVDMTFKNGKMTVTTSFKNEAALREQIRPGWNKVMGELLELFGMSAEEGADMLTGLFDFEGFFKNVTGSIAKEMDGNYVYEGDTLTFDGAAFATATVDGSKLTLTLSDEALGMYRSDTYYNIGLPTTWILEK